MDIHGMTPPDLTQGHSDKHRAAIEAAAQVVLDVREAEFARCAQAGQHCSLALLYNPETMPAALVQAHAELDRAVDAAYGYTGGNDDASRVAFLFERYSELVAQGSANATTDSIAAQADFWA